MAWEHGKALPDAFKWLLKGGGGISQKVGHCFHVVYKEIAEWGDTDT